VASAARRAETAPPTEAPSVTPLLEVRDLAIGFDGEEGLAEAVSGVGLCLERGRTLCLVGESGCGKSTVALALLGLIPVPPGRILSGRVLLDGRDLLRLPERELRRIRGNRISMVFQEPMTSLNPALTVGEQITEVLHAHRSISRRAARAEAVELLARMRIPQARARIDDYPHQLSGGMRQRVMIAIALACGPDLVVADEPTTALDVTVQAQILEMLVDLRTDLGSGLLLITHDLGVVAEVADEVAVMYAGTIVERCDVRALFTSPHHPYTIGLLGALPTPWNRGRRLAVIEGQVPPATAMPPGCRFHPRCPFAVERCRREPPPLVELGDGHEVACWRAPL
jgi:peptide/nickel transport system ATP-binding protein